MNERSFNTPDAQKSTGTAQRIGPNNDCVTKPFHYPELLLTRIDGG
ncbi:MAG: hypothetical protein ABI939_12365 [Anaerolineaceae bacterium]